MVIRRETLKDIGYFDEQFFAYQEDSDYCLRAKERGWKVYYNPHSIVKHMGGMGGANSVPMKAIFEWHRSYYKYYFKHFADDYSMIFNIFYSIAMAGKLIFAEGKYLIKQ
jgi:GT2 family glycosyltransferase